MYHPVLPGSDALSEPANLSLIEPAELAQSGYYNIYCTSITGSYIRGNITPWPVNGRGGVPLLTLTPPS